MVKSYSKKAGRVVRYKLADGTIREKRYPAYEPKRPVSTGDTVGDLIESWGRSPEWGKMAPNTKAQYSTYSRHLLGIESVRVKEVERRSLLEIRDLVSVANGPGAAIAFCRTASAAFGWGMDRGWLEHSPATRLRKGLSSGHLPAWSEQDAEMALTALPEHLRRAVVLALHTGQRRGDLIAMPWSCYRVGTLTLTQEKTGQPMVIPVTDELRVELDAWRASATSTMILTNKFGRPWKGQNLSKQLQEALSKIDGFPSGRNIHGLRKLAARNLAQAGCTPHEIAAITGHRSLAMISLYTRSVDQEQAAMAAVVKLEARRKG